MSTPSDEVLKLGERAYAEHKALKLWADMAPEFREAMASQAPPHAGPWEDGVSGSRAVRVRHEGNRQVVEPVGELELVHNSYRRDRVGRVVVEIYRLSDARHCYRVYMPNGSPGTSFDGGTLADTKQIADADLHAAGWELAP